MAAAASPLTCLLAICLGSAVGAANARLRSSTVEAVTPVEKVTDLLRRLQTQLEEEAKQEAASYDKYACFCKENIDEKNYDIGRSTKKISKLLAGINELNADIADLDGAISGLATQITALEGSIQTAADIRSAQHAAYLVEAQNLTDGIAALEGAIVALKESKVQMKESALGAKLALPQLQALAQRALGSVGALPRVATTEGQLRAVAALAQGSQDPEVYEYRSNDIIAVLQDLLEQFRQTKKELDGDEFHEQAAYDKRDLNMQNEKSFKEKEKAEKGKISAYKTEQMNEAEEEKVQETNEKNADVNFQRVLEGDCEEKARLWDQRSRVRAQELQAIAQALELLATKVAPSWKANKKLVGLQKAQGSPAPAAAGSAASVPAARSPSFLQVRGASSGEGQRSAAELQTAVARRVQRLLSDRADELGSKVLAMTAVRVRVADDHFVKVRSIIKDILARLADDAQSEATQKTFCDRAMSEGIVARDGANSEIERLTAEKSQQLSEKQRLLAEIAELSRTVAATQRALMEATQLRSEESDENRATIATATEGKEASELALRILREFYGEAATELVQRRSGYVPPDSDREGLTVKDRAPEVFDGKYKGNQKSATGIIGILEVILADFERTIDTVTLEEQAAAAAYTQLKTDAEKVISDSLAEKATKEGQVETIEDTLVQIESDLMSQNKLLDTALATLQGLEAQCVEGEETYAERVAARVKEIEALKEAHAILESWQTA